MARRLSDRFAEAARACADLPQLGALVGDAARELGFRFFALLDHSSVSGSRRGHVRLDNYPEEWVEEFVARGYAAHDPVHCASLRTNAGFGWCELGSLIRLERRRSAILARSRRFGIGAA